MSGVIGLARLLNPQAIVATTFLLLQFLGLLLQLAGAAPAIAQALPQVSDIRFGVQEGATRIVLDLDQRLEIQASTADGPPRLIVDLPEVRWALASQGAPRAVGLARGQRWGRMRPGHSRLVVDLGRLGTVRSSFWIAPNPTNRAWRFVIDIDRATKAAPAAPGASASTPPLPVPRPEMPGVPRDGRPIIVIDPGHGGIDPGTVGAGGVLEKEITLAMAEQLRETLLATGRYRVALTRDSDTFLALRERIDAARKAEGALFVSLHADSIGERMVSGASVYTLSATASDAEAERLAAKENKVDVLIGTDLSQHDPVVASILLDLVQRDTNNKSIALADVMAEELGDVTKLLRNTRRFAGFAVLKSPDIPSVLVELGYLSNPGEAAKLSQASHRRRIAHAIVKAVDRHFAALK